MISLKMLKLVVVPRLIYDKLQSLNLDSSYLVNKAQLQRILTNEDLFFYKAINKKINMLLPINFSKLLDDNGCFNNEHLFDYIDDVGTNLHLKDLSDDPKQVIYQAALSMEPTADLTEQTATNRYVGSFFKIDQATIGYLPVPYEGVEYTDKITASNFIKLVYEEYYKNSVDTTDIANINRNPNELAVRQLAKDKLLGLYFYTCKEQNYA